MKKASCGSKRSEKGNSPWGRWGIGGVFIFSCGGKNFDGRFFQFFLSVSLVISKVIRRRLNG